MKRLISRPLFVLRGFSLFGLAFGVGLSVMAQAPSGQTSQYDHGTPPQQAAGVSPIGSYISTELGTVNLANGALNFRIPIGSVGGRGFSMPLTLSYSSKLWSAGQTGDAVQDPTPKSYPAVFASYNDTGQPLDNYNQVAPGWTVGGAPYLKVRGTGINIVHNINGCNDFTWVLTKLYLELPDKGEIEFRDDQTDGAPQAAQAGISGCKTMDGYRGTRWHATDGSGMIFVSDNDNGIVKGDLLGTVITADGMQYRFKGSATGDSAYLNVIGRCKSIEDRNGNMIQITLPSSTEIDYTDQLGRVTKVQWGPVSDPRTNQPVALLVTLPGYNGQSRYYSVLTGTMSSNYRSDYLPVTKPVINGDYDPEGYGYTWPGNPTRLFPLSYGNGEEEIDTQSVLAQIVLPDQRALSFTYNIYGEVAEVQLPTGGKIQYDYGYVSTMPTGNSLNFEVHTEHIPSDVRQIDRGVVQKRTLPDGSTVEGTWNYIYNATTTNGVTTGNTEVQCHDAANNLLLDQVHYFNPAQRYLAVGTDESIEGSGYSLWSTGTERRVETRDKSGTVMMANEQDWFQRQTVSWTSGYPQEQPENDNRVSDARKILDDGSIAKTHTDYDTVNNPNADNPSDIWEYDFDNSLKRHTNITYFGGSGYGKNYPHLIRLPLQQTVYDGPTGIMVSQTSYEYDNYTAGDGKHAALVGYSSITEHDDTGYPTTYLKRGNPTQIQKWVSGSTHTYSYPNYDVLGNVVAIQDPRTNVTTFSFQDDFGTGSNPGGGQQGSNGATYAFPTLITSPPPDPGKPQQTARSQYDFNTGLLTGFKDRNGIITQTLYNDPFNRPTLSEDTLGIAGVETHTAIYYAPTSNPFGVTLAGNDFLTAKDQTSLNDGNLRSWTHTDGFGRVTENWTHDSDMRGDIRVVTAYDALGRKMQVSNPYRPGDSQDHLLSTTISYDLAGRVKSVTTPDGAVVNTNYNSKLTTVIDQANVQRRSTSDGLGRLVKVEEMYPSPSTSVYNATTYVYDALDDLTSVAQGGQNRNFSYDGLKRLTVATNPESGTTSYQYDPNGNLTKKTDARNISANYTYDALNRVEMRTYSDTTPGVTYTYDTATLGIGRLASVTSSVSTYSYGTYDERGRVKLATQTTSGNPYQMSYGYDLAGEMTSQTYPSGRLMTTGFDQAGRVSAVSGQQPGQSVKTYAPLVQYASHGAINQLTLGNGLVEATTYNNRLQPTDINLGPSGNLLHLQYGYNSAPPPQSNNNGNVLSQTINIPGLTFTQNYAYDPVNRLLTASESVGGPTQWSQSYSYDVYGNRAVAGYVPNPILTPAALSAFNASTNRFVASVNDAAGNQTQDAAGSTFTYDAENKQTSSTVSGTGASYSYDGDGRRVTKTIGAAFTIYVYNVLGQLVAEYGGQTSSSNVGTCYLTTDNLGSIRVVTNSSGGELARHDYLPFGEEILSGISGRTVAQGYGSSDDTRQKFTSKETDNESGLDYFGARYCSSAQGRFTSVDPTLLSARPAMPQSWNRYTYAINNPLRYLDPNGLIWGELNGDIVWYADEGALKRAGATAYTQSRYKTKDGRYVYLSPSGPHPQADPNDTTQTGILHRQGWVYEEQGLGNDYGAQFAIGGGIKAGVSGGVSFLDWLFGTAASEGTEGAAGAATEVITGATGTVTRETLESLASEGGPAVQVFTKLTQAPEAGRALSVWVGETDAALADGARSAGQVYTANIPTALLTKLESVGLAATRTTQMAASSAIGTEIRFSQQATEFVVRFFQK